MKSKNHKKTIGSWGEGLAVDYLRERNYHILAKNYQKPWGEIDLIAEKDGVIVFCEVKTNGQDQGSGFAPELRVNSKKARHILRTAKIFLGSHYAGTEKEWRLDIISVTLKRASRQAVIKHFKNALFDTS